MNKEVLRLKAKCPSNWDILPFGDAIKDATGGNPKVKKGTYKQNGLLAVIDQGQELIGGYIDDKSLSCKEKLPCILFGDHTKIIKFIDQPFALGADGVKVLVPKGEFDKRFLFHYLNTLRLPDNAGYSRHFKFLKEKAVVKPPLPEQKRISAILDKADAIRRKRQQAIKLADEFLRATFLDMFGDPKINPKNWKKKKINQLGKVVTGNTPSRKVPENFGSYIEWIKSDNINTPYHMLTKAEEGLSETGIQIGRTVPANSTLVTCIAGTPECIGNAALTDRLVAFNQQINAIVPLDNVDPYFLYVLVIISKKIIQSASTNSMKGMVSKGIFQEIELISPPYDLQKKFGAYFHAYLNYLGKQELHLIESDNLFYSFCQNAFRGEL